MSNFKIGEKVVCVNPTYNLVKNEIYKIDFIVNCNCGHSMFNLSGINKHGSEGKFDLTQCKCGIIHDNPDLFGIHRFRKLDYEFAENLLKEISESVNQKHLQN